MRRLFAIAALIALSAFPAVGAPARWRIETVATQQTSGEPGITTDATGRWSYYNAPEGPTTVWRKGPSGKWLGPVASNQGSGDSDVSVDADGVVYALDLDLYNGTNPVSVSLDHAASFAYHTAVPPNTGQGLNDRQWILTWGHGQVLAMGRLIRADETSSEIGWVSRDRARTLAGPIDLTGADNVATVGHPFRSVDGTIYLPYARWLTPPASVTPTSPEVAVAISHDGGATWTQRRVGVTVGDTPDFPSVATDDAGHVYVAWDETRSVLPVVARWATLGNFDIGSRVLLAWSSDQGTTWSAPKVVSDPNRTAVFPWVVAGAQGRIDVGWLGARSPLGIDIGPDLALPPTQWDVEVAQSLDAGRRWNHEVVAADVHTGSVCTLGVACLSPENFGFVNAPLPFDRRLLDFISGWVTPRGNVLIAYAQDRPHDSDPNDTINSWVDLKLAVQTGGHRLR